MSCARSRRLDDERGVSLIEVLAASILTLMVLLTGYGILTTTTRSIDAVTTRTLNTNGARLALDSLEANLRYADGAWVTTCPSDALSKLDAGCPASATSLTVENAPGSSTTRQPVCAQWFVTAGGLTERAFRSGCVKAVCGRATAAYQSIVASNVTRASFAVLTTSAKQTGVKEIAAADLALAHHLVQVLLRVGSITDSVTVDALVTPDNSSIAGRSDQSTVLCG